MAPASGATQERATRQPLSQAERAEARALATRHLYRALGEPFGRAFDDLSRAQRGALHIAIELGERSVRVPRGVSTR